MHIYYTSQGLQHRTKSIMSSKDVKGQCEIRIIGNSFCSKNLIICFSCLSYICFLWNYYIIIDFKINFFCFSFLHCTCCTTCMCLSNPNVIRKSCVLVFHSTLCSNDFLFNNNKLILKFKTNVNSEYTSCIGLVKIFNILYRHKRTSFDI